MKNSPSAEIVHIYTAREIQQVFGKEALAHFLGESKLVIQSTKRQKNGKDVKYSEKQIASIWGGILDGLTSVPNINIGQLIRNFHNKNTSPSQKKSIVDNLFRRTMSQYYHGADVDHEAIMLGFGMIFQDELDWENADSIVHIIGNAVDTVLSERNAE